MIRRHLNSEIQSLGSLKISDFMSFCFLWSLTEVTGCLQCEDKVGTVLEENLDFMESEETFFKNGDIFCSKEIFRKFYIE